MSNGYLPPLVKQHMDRVEDLAINGHFEGDFPDSKKLKPSDAVFKAATMDFQEFAGLIPDGDYGPVSDSRRADKRCGLPNKSHGFVKKNGRWCEFNVESACTRKWSDSAKNGLTCCHNMSFGSLSKADLDKAWWQGCIELMKVCGITFKRVPYTTKANFHHEKESIDGNGGTLAYHYLCGCNAGPTEYLAGRYDSGERWDSQFFQAVDTHEKIHGLGLHHSSDPNDLEYPYARRNIFTPQTGDIRRLQALYGKPTGTVPTDPTEPPTDLEGRVTKLETDVMINRAAIEILARR